MNPSPQNTKHLLDAMYQKYATPEFAKSDPIQIPKQYSRVEDIEIAAFLTASIAWGQRKSIIKSARNLMSIMGESPYEYIMSFDASEPAQNEDFVHRTFNGIDRTAFLSALRMIYKYRGGLRTVFTEGYNRTGSIRMAIHHFRTLFLGESFPSRTRKHVADVMSGSAAKRLNMFLRWMVRPTTEGIDLGLWSEIPTHALMIPLDVHVGRVSRTLGLLQRKQDDWAAVEELTGNLRLLDADDPVRFDFGFMGMGMGMKD